jgi:anthranilate phosphoribosyltransferase
MIKEAIAQIVSGQDLTKEEAKKAMDAIMDGEATSAQIGSFITALRIKGETVDEITGMAITMRQKSLKVQIGGALVDTAGTGGDGQNTINVSTAAALVAAAAGVRVAKHGNRAASSVCGSADVLEASGVNINLNPEEVSECIQKVGFGFMFAQIFHPAMHHAGGPRREIGIRTVFNILGPLTNPAGANAQILGVSSPTVGEKMAAALGNLGVERAMVVNGEEGLDEISICGPTTIWELKNGSMSSYSINPEDAGLARSSGSILGGSKEENAKHIRNILQGHPGPLLDVVLLNAAATIVVAGMASTLKEGVLKARQAINSGAGTETLEKLVGLTQMLSSKRKP